jgi:Tol biopolymer transport system component/DNA-binding winged helix-turn-helix (wHTH) protein
LLEKTAHCFEFGPFVLNPESRSLTKDGAPVTLTTKTLETLSVLVQNRGKVMSKDELLAALWPDTVVEEANLTQSISTLRKILGDSPKDHRYIVTLAGRGYQFVADVKVVTEESDVAEIAVAATAHQRRPRLLWAGVTCLAVIAFAGFVWFLLNARGSSSGTFPSREIPLTSKVGIVTLPSFSPDGRQIAYSWAPTADSTSSIYVKSIAAGTELRLTNPPGHDGFPAWSPDGQWVAFWRALPGNNGIYIVSALGGPVRRVIALEDCRGFGWFPDGKHLIVSESSGNQHFRLASVDVASGQRQPLLSSPGLDEGAPALSPDGKTLGFIGWDAARNDLYLRSMDGGPARLLVENAGGVLAWTADGSEIVFSWNRPGLWRIPVKGGTPRPVTSNAWSLGIPAIARHGNRLAYVVNELNENFWRIDLSSGSPKRAAPPVQLENSVRQQWDPSYSPDGRRLAFGSNRSGSDQIWVSDAQGGAAAQITHFTDVRPGCPRWSPDGASIAFNAAPKMNSDIYVIRPDGGEPRRITTNSGEDTVPSWSRDGRWIYFTSARSGQDQIWKVPAATGESPSTPAVQVTQDGGVDAFESTDGKDLYFAKGYEKQGLWRKELADAKGREEPVLASLQHWGWWALSPQGIYYFEQPESPSQAGARLKFLNLAAERTAQLATLEKPLNQSTAVVTLSPDGRSLVYTQTDRFGSDIMLIENFH